MMSEESEVVVEVSMEIIIRKRDGEILKHGKVGWSGGYFEEKRRSDKGFIETVRSTK